MNNRVYALIKGLSSKTIATRRELHKNPEPGFEEYKTAALICNRLDELGVAYSRGIAKTGVVAVVQGKKAGKTVLLRADMDALELDESNTVEYKSEISGKMHACGHDAHTAILLTVCEVLNNLRDDFCGSVKLVFQPAEEVLGGALPMLKEGILQNPAVDVCAALHAWPELDVGKVQTAEGTVYASPDNFEITIHGKGGHGAMPELCINPITAGAEIVSRLQNIEGKFVRKNEPFALSVCTFNGGCEYNVIPQKTHIRGTVRTLDKGLRKELPSIIEDVVKSVCQKHGAEYSFNFIFRYPPVVNDAKIARLIHQSAQRIVGDNAIWGGAPTLGGEDFAYFAERVPSAIFRLGCRNEQKGIAHPLHSPNFNIDEDCLDIGVAVFVDFTLSYLS